MAHERAFTMPPDHHFMKISLRLAARIDLNPTDKLILGYLQYKIGNNGECWPGIQTISYNVGLNRSTILRSIDRLVESQEIEVAKQGKGRANHYQLAASNRAQNAPSGEMQPGAKCASDQAQNAPTVGAKCAQNRAQNAPLRDRTNKRTKEKNITEPDGFALFWETYPRKVCKPVGKTAWAKAIEKADPETILAGLNAQLDTMLANEPQFRPHPSTWLNQERWSDEPPPPASKAQDDADGEFHLDPNDCVFDEKLVAGVQADIRAEQEAAREA